MVLAFVVLAVGSVVVAVVGRLGSRGRLPRNGWAGIRLPSTMRSDEAWDAAHRAGGPILWWTGVVTAVGSVVAVPLTAALGDPVGGAAAILLAVVLLAGVVWSSVVAVRATSGR